ncbi:hypothetical protein C8J56DRAFT_914107 [Mycena floridula]|nr:hypothetical protein C8J56DRAFT_914107 [Mycena floridula]
MPFIPQWITSLTPQPAVKKPAQKGPAPLGPAPPSFITPAPEPRDVNGMDITVQDFKSKDVGGGVGSDNIAKHGKAFAVLVSRTDVDKVGGSVGSGNQFHTEKLLTGRPGKKMSIGEFCKKYSVNNTIQQKLEEEGYDGSVMTLCDLTKEEMEDMRFNAGQIKTLQVAMKEWASEGVAGANR